MFSANMSLIDDCLTRMSRMAGLIFLPSFISVNADVVLCYVHSVFLRYFIRYSCAIIALRAREADTSYCGQSVRLFPVGQTNSARPWIGIHRLGILYAIAASMHEIPSFLSISATLLNEKFVLPERMRLTY